VPTHAHPCSAPLVAHIPQTARTPTRRHSSGRLKTPQGTGDDKPIYHLDERGMAEGGMAEGGMAEGGMAEGGRLREGWPREGWPRERWPRE